jgi:hypothetical protein
MHVSKPGLVWILALLPKANLIGLVPETNPANIPTVKNKKSSPN